jgi:5-(carboxyamino)imidazole ribonucleotide synthase
MKRIRRVGIIGAGQLGRMMALAATPMGLECTFLDRSADSPGAQIAPIVLGALDDARKIEALARRTDVLTFDWENLPADALAGIASRRIRPSLRALRASQDRLDEKALFSKLAIPVTPHAPIDCVDDLPAAVRRIGLPGVLKTRRLGYDGKGQFVLRSRNDLDRAWRTLGGRPLIYEKFLRFSGEVSLIGARAPNGEIVFYPLADNTHRDGILRYTKAPFVDAALSRRARSYLSRLFDALDYCGVLTVEFFIVEGRLIANEMAPRVHNSGHWTIEGCVTSQFENHIRAICGLPLGSTRPLGHAAMINFIGQMPSLTNLLAIQDMKYHDYGKEARPGRKLGHCTLLKADPGSRDRALKAALKLVRWS